MKTCCKCHRSGTKLNVAIVIYINPSSSLINRVCYYYENKVLSYGTEAYKNNVLNTRVKNVFGAIITENPMENYVNKALDDQHHVFFKNGIMFYIQSQSNEENGTFTMYCAEAEAYDFYQAVLTGKESPYPKVLQNKEAGKNSEASNNVESDFVDDEARRSDVDLQFPQLGYGDYLENQDGHRITVNGFDGATYSIDISIVRAIGLDCTATISDDKMYFSSVMPAGGFTGYIQYNGQDYTLIFENSGYPLEAEKEFYGFYKQGKTSSLNPSDYIGTWSPGYEGLLLTIESFDGQLMQGTIYTDVGAIPFSGYYNAGLYTSYSYGEYLIDLALFEHFFNGTLSYLGIECSIKNQNYDILFGTTGETKLYK